MRSLITLNERTIVTRSIKLIRWIGGNRWNPCLFLSTLSAHNYRFMSEIFQSRTITMKLLNFDGDWSNSRSVDGSALSSQLLLIQYW